MRNILYIFVFQKKLTLIECIQPAEYIQQGAFARAGGAGDYTELPGLYMQVQIIQYIKITIVFTNFFCSYHFKSPIIYIVD